MSARQGGLLGSGGISGVAGFIRDQMQAGIDERANTTVDSTAPSFDGSEAEFKTPQRSVNSSSVSFVTPRFSIHDLPLPLTRKNLKCASKSDAAILSTNLKHQTHGLRSVQYSPFKGFGPLCV
jgi:hypothetical protein